MNMNEAVLYTEAAKCIDRPGKCAEVIQWLIEQLESEDRREEEISTK